MTDDALDLAELADQAGVSQRTVRYYVQQGLLPSPESRGPATRYEREHLDRLRLIRRLQREHLPLAEIRRRLEQLGAHEIRELLAREPDRPRSSAKDYIRKVLSGPAPRLEEPPALFHAEAAMRAKRRAPRSDRSQWERIGLASDVELHIRRPLTREQNRQVERLLEAARDIFQEDVP